jgi:hypothetical protein
VPHGAYLHNGFYTRLGLGLAYASMWGHGPNGAASVRGPGAGLLLSIGGTPVEGLVLAGTIFGANGNGSFKGAPPPAEGEPVESRRKGSAFAPLFGLIADWFPDPRTGWHAGGGFGLGGFSADLGDRDLFTGSTFGGTLFGGYDHWIGPEYSLGFMLVGTLALAADARWEDESIERVPTGYRFTTASSAIVVSLLFH